jgi:hypothetical protein
MTAGPLVRTAAHLAPHRRMILAHSVAAAAAGIVPIPYLDEWLPSVIRRAMLRRIAAAHQIDIDEDALRELADGPISPPSWRHLVALGPFLRTARRGLRTAFIAFNLYRRADGASRTFALGTLFDHYCARLHVGIGLDGAAARALRLRIDHAVGKRTPSLGAYLFQRGFAATARATLRAPVELWRALLARPADAEAEELAVEDAIDASLAAGPSSFLARTVRAVDRQLGALGSGWVAGLVDALEEP